MRPLVDLAYLPNQRMSFTISAGTGCFTVYGAARKAVRILFMNLRAGFTRLAHQPLQISSRGLDSGLPCLTLLDYLVEVFGRDGDGHLSDADGRRWSSRSSLA